MNKENNMELKSEYVEVEVLGYGLPLYNAIGSSGAPVQYKLADNAAISIAHQAIQMISLERMLSYHSLHRLCSPMRNFI